jgi:hypothetical protein
MPAKKTNASISRPRCLYLVFLGILAYVPVPFYFAIERTTHRDPDDVLHVVLVCFNYANFSSRPRSVRAQQARLAMTPNVRVYTVELVFGSADFVVTQAANPDHLQLRLRGDDNEPPLWLKEPMINAAVAKLLPRDWRAFAWVDAEVLFHNTFWAREALRMLTDGTADAVQPFSHGTSHQVGRNISFAKEVTTPGYRAPRSNYEWMTRTRSMLGFSWAFNRATFDAMPGGLFELDIGPGINDLVVAAALSRFGLLRIKYPQSGVPHDYSQDFHDSLHAYVAAVEAITPRPRLGYVEGGISHAMHGSLARRQYAPMRTQLVEYEPSHHVRKNSDGLLVPTDSMPLSIRRLMQRYWASRREDDSAIPEVFVHESPGSNLSRFAFGRVFA